MQSVNVRTAQNVGIDYQLAGLGDRILAFILDAIVIVVYSIAIGWLLSKIEFNAGWVQIFFFLPAFFYHLTCEIAFNGQSIGKKQMNIKVLRLDGSPATIGGYILRWILRPIDISLFSGGVAVVAIALSKNGQRLGDLAAGTTVVKLTKQVPVTSHQIIKNLNEDYEVTFPEAAQLSSEEVDIIRQALSANRLHANIKPVMAVTLKIKEHLNIQSELPPVKFLYTVIKDYNYLNSL